VDLASSLLYIVGPLLTHIVLTGGGIDDGAALAALVANDVVHAPLSPAVPYQVRVLESSFGRGRPSFQHTHEHDGHLGCRDQSRRKQMEPFNHFCFHI